MKVLLHFVKSLLINKPEFNNRIDKEEFESFRLSSNLHRSINIGITLFILDILLILIDIFVYKSMRSSIPAYLYLYYSHIVLMALILLLFALLKIFKSSDRIVARNLHKILAWIVLYWCIFMALNSIAINGQISAYIICVLAIASFFYLDLKETLITIVLSFLIFVVGLGYLTGINKVFYGCLVNSGIVVLLSVIVSNLNYSNFAKDYINKSNILKSKNELESNNKRLKEFEKQRTEFVANISHELRTPLNVIYSAEQLLDMVIQQQGNKERVDKYLKMIRQNSYRLLRLVNNLIDITKIETENLDVKLRNADIVKIVEDVTMSVVEYVESKGIGLIFDTEVEEKVIACDPDKIERIILNLLSNAVKFTENGGTIFVNINVTEDWVEVAVKDTGVGIEENLKESIFNRFVQIDDCQGRMLQGSGIGLTLVKSLVEMHGGSITVNSKVGEGSEFIIKLPDKAAEIQLSTPTVAKSKSDYVQMINIEFSDIYDS